MTKQVSAKNLVQREKIEVNLGDIISGYEAILSLARMEFPTIISYKISLAYKEIRREAQGFEDFKDSLRKEFATEKILENGQKTYDFGSNDQLVERKIKEEMMKKVSLNLAKLSLKDFEHVALQPSILIDLEWLFTE